MADMDLVDMVINNQDYLKKGVNKGNLFYFHYQEKSYINKYPGYKFYLNNNFHPVILIFLKSKPETDLHHKNIRCLRTKEFAHIIKIIRQIISFSAIPVILPYKV